jgi:hypothetical protein
VAIGRYYLHQTESWGLVDVAVGVGVEEDDDENDEGFVRSGNSCENSIGDEKRKKKKVSFVRAR